MKIASLTCENQKRALGVGTRTPKFGWSLQGEKNGEYQTAYQIVVTDEEGVTVWDSGKVESDCQLDIKMSAARLRPMEKYFYTVTVWDGEGKTASAGDWFLMGFYKVSQWKSQWYQIEDFDGIHYYRSEFDVSRTDAIDYAYLFVGAVGEKCNSCVPYLNGQRVGEFVNFPGATEYFHAFYTAVEVSHLLREGKNAIALKVAKSSSAVLKIKYRDGSKKEYFIQRDHWTHLYKGPYDVAGYPVPRHYGKCEEFDARREPMGWTEPGFDDSGWEHCTTQMRLDFGPLLLTPQYCTTKIFKQYRPVRLERQEEGWLVDFGTNMSGFATVTLRGRCGQSFEVWYAEKLDTDEKHAFITPYYPAYTKYTFAADGEVTYTPAFMHTGFRYIVLKGWEGDLTPDCLTANFIHSDVLDDTVFECSDPIVSRLNQVARQSFLSNLVNIPTDCPVRERRGWTADAYAVSEAECVNFDMLTFFSNWFESMRDCQRGCGWIPVELPIYTDGHVDVDWPAASVLIPYDVYLQYGDRDFLARTYEIMTRWVELLINISDDDYTICDKFLSYKDWLAIEPTTCEYLGMAYFFRCADLLSRISGVLGKTEDRARYTDLAKTLRDTLNARYLHETAAACWYDNGCQSADIHALYFGICPEHLRKKVTQHLVDNIHEKGASTSGFMAASGVLQTLSLNGRSDEAFRLLNNRNLGGWLYFIEKRRATTFPECFDEDHNLLASENHAFLSGSPALWLYKFLLGISPAEPGYKKVRIAPYLPEGITYAKGTVQTRYGKISAHWTQEGSERHLTIMVPPSVTALVEFDGRTAEVGSGTWNF